MSHEMPTPKMTETDDKGIGPMIGLGLVVIAFLVGFVWWKFTQDDVSQPDSIAAAKAQYLAEHPVPVVVQNVGKELTLHRFGSDGCVEMSLHGDWSDFPKGGEISFASLATSEVVLRDKPGTKTTSSLPAGDYRICKVEPAAWGVEILQ